MAESTEPRALTAALAAPAFITKAGGGALHAATRHVERWAPEAGAHRVASLRNLGFVDRLVSPWIEAAQRSSRTLRGLSETRDAGMFAERPVRPTSWLFPRPWYQDELDWMAAARTMSAQYGDGQDGSPGSPELFTTRGTYVESQQQHQTRSAMAMPSALYEFVAPSLSVAPPMRGDAGASAAAASEIAMPGANARGPRVFGTDAYSPLVPFAAAHAAQMMQRVVPLTAARLSPGLRTILTTMLERTAAAGSAPTRISEFAPEMVTPPAPRAPQLAAAADPYAIAQPQQAQSSSDGVADAAQSPSARVVEDISAQRVQLVELQRAARVVAERELAARTEQRTEQQQIARAAQQQQAAAAQASAPSTTTSSSSSQQQSSTSSSPAAVAAAQAAAVREQQQQIEARIAERIAERQAEQHATATVQRVQQQRLHEAARDAAVRDARQAAVAQVASAQQSPAVAMASRTPADLPVAPMPRMPAELVQAMTALSPGLASTVAASLAAQPDRAVQTIGELGEALRTVELLARSTAAGNAFESARGPRLVMPAGLGGLVATVDRAAPMRQSAPGFVSSQMMSPAAAAALATAAPQQAAQAPLVAPLATAARVPSISWLAPELAPRAAVPAALAATEASQPAALHHVAWADRWLARFAGARPRSLDTLAAASADPEERIAAIAAAAPGVVFVAPEFRDHYRADGVAAAEVAAAAEAAELAAAAPQVAPVQRFADDEATPDDVFASISAAAMQSRSTQAQVKAARRAGRAAPVADETPRGIERETFADVLAHAVPTAPDAGFAAQLASSPFAPAFRHVLPLAAAPTFDVRALFGDSLAASYLAGLLAPATHELAIASPITARTPWMPASIAAAASFEPGFESAGPRAGLEWDPAYVQPEVPRAALADAQALAQSPSQIDGQPQPLVEGTPEFAAAVAAATAAVTAAEQARYEQLTTVRSALLAWDVEVGASAGASPMSPMFAASAPLITGATSATYRSSGAPSVARSMAAAMSLPMMGELATVQSAVGSIDAGGMPVLGASYAAPGMIADRAQTWSIAQERSVADLAFDFVTPELVLAARVYGLGPAEAAQAMRLAIAGPGQLATMASTVDRTFVQALAIDAERRGALSATGMPGTGSVGGMSGSTAFARSDAGTAATFAPTSAAISAAVASASEPSASPSPSLAAAMPAAESFYAGAPTSAFGVERRMPRGAFMWPAATVAALGLTAASPDGEQSMSVAALELLAAQTVAALGTYAALGLDRPQLQGPSDFGESESSPASATAAAASSSATAASPLAAAAVQSLAPSAAQAAIAGAAPTEASETDVVSTATAMVPTSRRAKFEAMYVALGQSQAARAWSPAARAARALALAGRGDETITAQERAMIAWDVLPVVAPMMASGVDSTGAMDYDLAPGAARSTGTAAQRAAMIGAAYAQMAQSAPGAQVVLPDYVEHRPGLAALSARAGEALGSYVAPASAAPTSSGSSGSSRSSRSGSDVGAVLRAPTAAPELVRTGRPSGRFGGGEVEIPTWFETAARKMFDQQQGSGPASELSISELTLITAAPSNQIAASSRSMPGAAPTNPSPSSQSMANSQSSIDIEKVANDVYRQVLVLMDSARFRNGEPYL